MPPTNPTHIVVPIPEGTTEIPTPQTLWTLWLRHNHKRNLRAKRRDEKRALMDLGRQYLASQKGKAQG